jgi:hypothetical protein
LPSPSETITDNPQSEGTSSRARSGSSALNHGEVHL